MRLKGRQGIEILAKSLNIDCRSFTTARELLEQYDTSWNGCLLINLCLGGTSGLQLQRKALGPRMPNAGHSDRWRMEMFARQSKP